MNMNIDFNKYKRIFAFGCSFTQYVWPTWADIIAHQYPNVNYYNHGHSGMGNLGITCRIAEANARYNFCETDLIMVMWSTFCREDRWFQNGWKTFGNVFNSEYPKEFVDNFCDPLGYLIRDHALISQTNSHMKNIGCGYIALKSTPFEYTEHQTLDKDYKPVLRKLYQEEYDKMPLELYAYMNYNWGLCEQVFFDDLCDKPRMRHDFHPFTSLYAEYLKHIGFHITDETLEYAKNADEILKACKTRTEINKNFDYLATRQGPNKQFLF